MDGYFEHIVDNLTHEDLMILTVLNDKEANAAFSSQRRNKLFEKSELSLANFRKTINKLFAARLINVVTGGKEHRIYITNYGVEALYKSVEGVEHE